MKRLEGIEMWNTWEVARRVNELAEETRAKLDCLFERMDSIEGVGRDKAEPADWDDEGDPGECPECGAPYQIVRPGKVQETCRCYEVAALERDIEWVKAGNERLRADNARLACGYAERLGDHQEYERLGAENVALCAERDALRTENEELRADNAVKRAALATMADWNRAVEEGR